MYQNMVKSGLISGGHIRPGPDMTGYENMAGFRPGPGPDMISGATLTTTEMSPIYWRRNGLANFDEIWHVG